MEWDKDLSTIGTKTMGFVLGHWDLVKILAAKWGYELPFRALE
jgi:hypothetical protein